MFPHPKYIQHQVRMCSSIHQAGFTTSGKPCQHLDSGGIQSCEYGWILIPKSLVENQGNLVPSFSDDTSVEICIWCFHQAAHGVQPLKKPSCLYGFLTVSLRSNFRLLANLTTCN